MKTIATIIFLFIIQIGCSDAYRMASINVKERPSINKYELKGPDYIQGDPNDFLFPGDGYFYLGSKSGYDFFYIIRHYHYDHYESIERVKVVSSSSTLSKEDRYDSVSLADAKRWDPKSRELREENFNPGESSDEFKIFNEWLEVIP